MSLEDINTGSLTEIIQTKQERTLKSIERYKRKFEAAAFSRLNSTWATVDFSPSQELFNDLQNLKVRSRDLYCNSPVVSNFVSLLQQNVVGHKGFAFKSKVQNSKGGLNVKVAKQIEEAWNDFISTDNFEVTGQYSLTDALDSMVQSLAVDGEILAKKVYGLGKYGFQVQLLHSEQLPVTPRSDYSEFTMGIKRNQFGRPIEYVLYDRHPSEGMNRFVVEPAERIVHAFIPYQIGAPRGIPMSVASMATIKMLDEYRKAELVAARIEASKFVIYTQKQPDDLDSDTALDLAIPASQKKNAIQPGMSEVLPPGVDAKYLDPTHPNTAFPSFTNSLKKEISAGLGLSYNTLYSDFENTSFSSMRAAFISERAFYRKIQNLFIEKVLRVLFESFIDAACISGKLNLPPVMGSYDFYKTHEFTGKAYEFSNPLQEAEAQKLMLDERLMSRTQICAERGVSYSDVLEDIVNEIELEKSKGITLGLLPKGTTLQPVPSDLKIEP